MPFFDRDGVAFNYRDEGSGLPFFFQHGLGADLTQPFGLFKPPPGIRMIAFDCRAHGLTHPVGDPEKVAIRCFADDLGGLMEHLKIREAVVGGISMGAAVTLNFTLRYPKRVRGLVLSRPAWTDGPHPWNVNIFTLISKLVREHGPVRGQELFRQTPEYKEALEKWPDVAQSLAGQFEHPDVEETVFKLTRIITDSPCTSLEELRSIDVPTLVLANDLDPIHPLEFGLILKKAIRGADFRQITSKSVSVEKHEQDVQAALTQYFQTHFLSC
jgi:pimeloyl-ACP methyl ester carboxylesterase